MRDDAHIADMVSTHSRPKAAESSWSAYTTAIILFQHTAARRRLIL